MTVNAQTEKPFGGAARPQAWVMRSLSPWIRRMAAGPASRASSSAIATGKPIGAQAVQQAHWLSRRADRIQRAAAWNGELGAVSPALVDRFAQRVANRVQRSARSHQVDAYAGGDNLDSRLDMPLVSNEGLLAPLSDGNTSDTPFEFGAFSPEHAKPKPQPEAPAAPPISDSLRNRAEQLRRSLATNTPASAIQPARSAPSIQPSRAPAMPGATQSTAPRAGVMRARPATRIEELGPGKAPAPAPATSPMPEPPKPLPAQVQRAAQLPSARPTPATPTTNVQRAAVPPQVVQGQGRLTQMLNARFKPKLDEARNPDAPRDNTSDFTPDVDAGTTSDDAPRISRSAVSPEDRSTPDVSADLTPREPIRRAPADDASATRSDAPADVPLPKPRVLRKPALSVTKPPAPTSPPTATVQRKGEVPASTPSTAQPTDDAHDAPVASSPIAPTPLLTATPDTPMQVVPQVQREPVPPTTQPRENVTRGKPANASPAIQRAVDMPLAAPAAPAETSDETSIEKPAPPDAPAIQRAPHHDAAPPSAPATSTLTQTPAAAESIQHSAAPMSAPSSQSELTTPPIRLSETAPHSAPAAPSTDVGDALRRSAATEANAAPPTPAQAASPLLDDAAPATVQRMAVNAPLAESGNAVAADADVELPLVQRAPAIGESADAQTGAVPASASAAVGVKQRAISHDNIHDQPAALPLHQNAPAPAADTAPSTESRLDVDATVSERNMGVIQRVPATMAGDTESLTLQTPPVQPERAPVSDADDAGLPSSLPASQAATPVAGAPAIQRSMETSAQIPSSTPAIQRSADAEMVLRTPAQEDAAFDMGDESSAWRDVSSDAQQPPAVVRRQAAPKSLTRMAGVAMADMPVLRAAAGTTADGVMQPEARTLAMPIVQRATVKHEQRAAQAAQTRPVNPYVSAQVRAEAMPVVQRAPVNEATEVQRAEMEPPLTAPAPSAEQAPAKARAISDAELTRAAQRILPIIKRLLAVERERLFGR